MASRNFFKTAALIPEPWLPVQYAVNVEETLALINIVQTQPDGLLEAFRLCMRYGYVMGHRATKKGVYKEVRPKRKDRT